MTEQTFNECFNWIQKFHGKVGLLDAQVKIDWWATFRDCSDELFCDAAKSAVSQLAPGFFPTIDRMQGFLKDAQDRVWAKQKSSTPTLFSALRREKSEVGRRALAMIIDFLKGRVSKEEYLAFLLAMEEKRPGVGWKESADQLEKIWQGQIGATRLVMTCGDERLANMLSTLQ